MNQTVEKPTVRIRRRHLDRLGVDVEHVRGIPTERIRGAVPGQMAIVDTSDRELASGGHFVISGYFGIDIQAAIAALPAPKAKGDFVEYQCLLPQIHYVRVCDQGEQAYLWGEHERVYKLRTLTGNGSVIGRVLNVKEEGVQ